MSLSRFDKETLPRRINQHWPYDLALIIPRQTWTRTAKFLWFALTDGHGTWLICMEIYPCSLRAYYSGWKGIWDSSEREFQTYLETDKYNITTWRASCVVADKSGINDLKEKHFLKTNYLLIQEHLRTITVLWMQFWKFAIQLLFEEWSDTNAQNNCPLLLVLPSSSSTTAAPASSTTTASIAASSATTAAAETNKFCQLGVDDLLGLWEDRDKIFGFWSITGSEQSVACASVTLTTSST